MFPVEALRVFLNKFKLKTAIITLTQKRKWLIVSMSENHFEKRVYVIGTLIWLIPGFIGVISSIIWLANGGDLTSDLLVSFAFAISVIFMLFGGVGFILAKFKDKRYPKPIDKPLIMLVLTICMYIYTVGFLVLIRIFLNGPWPFLIFGTSFCLAFAIYYNWLYFQKRRSRNPGELKNN